MTAGHDDDPISAASSGLRALGVPPQRRIETLGLLSALLDLADARGEVVLDTQLIATEERLGIDACLEGYEWLERLGVIRRTWAGWQIPHFAEHQGPAGMNEAAMAVLARHMSAAGSTDSVPSRVVAPELPAQPSAPVVALHPWRKRVPAAVATVAAGIAVLTGATQLVPQAAVSQRDATVRTEGTTPTIPAGTASSVAAPGSVAAAATTAAPATTAAAAPDLTTTTTSTTLLPGLPCLTQAVEDLASRTGLGLPRDSDVLPPGVLPCP